MIVTEKQLRRKIFSALLPYYGKIATPQFLRDTAKYIPGIDRIHPLVEGIYKPAKSEYALSIASMKVNPYADKLTYLSDGRWFIKYSAKSGGNNISVNQGLFKCMMDEEPVIVLKQLSSKASRQGSKYRIMGLGLIESYDADQDTFTIQHLDFTMFERLNYGEQEEKVVASALCSNIMEKFTPFIEEDKAIYKVSAQKRDKAFKDVVLEQYAFACAVTGSKYHSDNMVEAQAAHIIPRKINGSDDPRNGIALCRTAHWAFDQGMFTISDQYEILVHPKARHAKVNNFPILDLDRRPINKPEDVAFWPHIEAIAWHNNEIFKKFHL